MKVWITYPAVRVKTALKLESNEFVLNVWVVFMVWSVLNK